MKKQNLIERIKFSALAGLIAIVVAGAIFLLYWLVVLVGEWFGPWIQLALSIFLIVFVLIFFVLTVVDPSVE